MSNPQHDVVHAGVEDGQRPAAEDAEGQRTSTDIVAAIKAGGGNATLTTVAGEKLSARLSGNSVVITDGKGGQSTVTAVDLMQSNGVVHVIDAVLLP